MANLQPSASVEPSIMASPSPIGGGAAVAQGGNDLASVQQLVVDLCDPALRKHALDELSKKKVMFQDRLAPLLWDSFGTIAALLQEILSIYPALSPPTLSSGASNRVCSVLALLQSVASHPETRMRFLDANIPVYLYPFLNTHSETRPFEYLRLTSLGVIGALVKVDDSKVISFLLKNEIVPLCLRCMEIGSELSKTCDFWTSSQHREVSFNQHVAAKTTKLRACFYFWVATFIVQKILIDDFGLRYMCDNPDRLFAVANLLAYMVVSHPVEPHVPTTARLLKHIIRCFRRLSDNANACSVLQLGLPDVLKDGTVDSYLVTQDDPGTRRCLQQLLYNVAVGAVGRAPHPGLY